MKKYIAKTLFGLEEVLEIELNSLGAKKMKVSNRAIHFEADLNTMYRINLASRVALKILFPILNFRALNPDQLYKKTTSFQWSNMISVDDTFLIDSTVNSINFKHSKYAALRLKDAIVDQIRKDKGKRPSVSMNNPTFRINLHIDDNNCTIALDSSGESLHRRGYRLRGEKAPLNEVLAAGMILISGWDGKSNFIDPMCGSGTLGIEAAMIGLNIPPNLFRENFGFMKWESFNRNDLKSVKSELISERKRIDQNIHCNDISPAAIKSAQANAKRAKVESVIRFSNEDFLSLENNSDSGTMIINPPYGERLKPENVISMYKDIGDTLKNKYEDFDAWILSSNNEALKQLGLRTSKRLLIFNGPLECKFHNYKLYKGSKKKKYE